MINRKKEENGWEFLFIGANIDAVETAARYGISADRAVNYHADGEGTAHAYCAVEAAVSQVRRHRAMGHAWRKNIDKDYQKRK